MKYFLGVDVGSSKTHALIADESGKAVGFGGYGAGNWERVGYAGLEASLKEVFRQALASAGLSVSQISAAGMGLSGYDWPTQRQAHLDAIQPLGLSGPLQIVNDAVLGILAGAEHGWGVSVVSGSGCNCRGWSQDRRKEGRMVGGGDWSGEYGSGWDILGMALQAIVFEWNQRGPSTVLTPVFIERLGAANLDDLIEGLFFQRYHPDPDAVRLVFNVAEQGDPQALAVIRWAGNQLGQMACGVIRQLSIQDQTFDTVLIGSIFRGQPLLTEFLAETVHALAPHARLVRLDVPPVVGGVVLAMEQLGLLEIDALRQRLIQTTCEFMKGA